MLFHFAETRVTGHNTLRKRNLFRFMGLNAGRKGPAVRRIFSVARCLGSFRRKGKVSPQRHRGTEEKPRRTIPRAARAKPFMLVSLCLCASVVNIPLLLVGRSFQEAVVARSMGSFRRIPRTDSHHSRSMGSFRRLAEQGSEARENHPYRLRLMGSFRRISQCRLRPSDSRGCFAEKREGPKWRAEIYRLKSSI